VQAVKKGVLMQPQRKRESRINSSLSITKPSEEMSPPSKPSIKRDAAKKAIETIAPLSEGNELNTIQKMTAALKMQKKSKELFPILEDLVETAIVLLRDGIRNTEEKKHLPEVAIRTKCQP
jgi:hypothetical protein